MFLIMEKDIGKIKKNDITDIVVRIDDFGGKIGMTIREFTTSDRYTGFTKSGTRIPAESFAEFKQMISSINESDFQGAGGVGAPEGKQEEKVAAPVQQDLSQSSESSGESSGSEEIKEEVF